MPFYKREGEELFIGDNFVVGPNGLDLRAETHDQHTYPVDGWYWFDNLDGALSGLPRDRSGVAVTMRQARLALLGAGLLDTVNSALASMTGAAGEAARIEWDYSNEVRRDSALIAALAPSLGLTDSQTDDLFAVAETL